MLGDVDTSGEPDPVVPGDVIHEPLERPKAPRPTDEPAVETDVHQAWCRRSLRVQHVERVTCVLEERKAPVEPWCRREPVVVDVSRVGNHQQWLTVIGFPVRQLVSVAVLAVDKPSLIDHEANRVLTATAQEVVEWTTADDPCLGVDREPQLFPLLILGHSVMIDPSVAVAGDLPAALDHGPHSVGIALKSPCHTIDGDRDVTRAEEPVQPPEADPRAVLVHGLDREVASTDLRLGKAKPGEQ